MSPENKKFLQDCARGAADTFQPKKKPLSTFQLACIVIALLVIILMPLAFWGTVWMAALRYLFG